MRRASLDEAQSRVGRGVCVGGYVRPRSLRLSLRTWTLQFQGLAGLRGLGKTGRLNVGIRATHDGAGVDVITPRRAALHFQLDSGMIICTELTNDLLAPGPCHPAGTGSLAPSPSHELLLAECGARLAHGSLTG